MKIAKRITFTALLAGAIVAHPAFGGALDDREIKLSGCLVRGDGDGAGYLLSNTPAEPALSRPANSNVAPTALGTSGAYTTIFYWLDGDGDLKNHVGNRVEIEGDLKDDFKEGEIEIDRKEKWTELTVKADGRTMKANVPHTSSLPAPGTDGDSKNDILVRRVDVSKVRMLAASCES
ncbi:MAG: hypothetical protein GEU82_19185 [Luteitalea sp.]|nr:hypothetical protein [Luteitalea sp.]